MAENLGQKVLKTILWLTVAWYIVLIAISPTEFGRKILVLLITKTHGASGMFKLIFAGPVFFLVFAGSLYLYLFPRSLTRKRKKKAARASLGTHPVIVSGPFGVVTAAELLWIVGFISVMTWVLIMLIIQNLRSSGEEDRMLPPTKMWQKRLKIVAIHLGVVGQICLGMLFLPVSRGSVLLRLIDIPFEHAAKYHVWLGHFTMSLFSLHGLTYILTWIWEGRLDRMIQWKIHGVSNLAGEISLAAGLLMWATSFKFTRIHAFELFFYTHQLYIVFVVFMVLHVGENVTALAFAGIFLFAFDRFLRFCQSRSEVAVLTATLLPCGTYELTLPKRPSSDYNALSFAFLNFPAVSRFEWHPFSVSSGPKENSDNMKFLIKPLGTWTRQLGEAVKKAALTKCPLRLEAAVEGPYGHETSYFLDYEALLLVAGGIGVSPFIAIIRDLLQRYQMNDEPGLPKDVTLIWAVKHRKELRVLDSLHPSFIFPEYALRLNLVIHAYVTQESQQDLEAVEESDVGTTHQRTEFDSSALQKPISHLVGSGSILWVGSAIAASVVGYIAWATFVGALYLGSEDHGGLKMVPSWVRGCSLILGVLFAVLVCGGSVILLWGLCSPISKPQNSLGAAESEVTEPLLGNSVKESEENPPIVEKLIHRSNTVYGVRPDLQDLFEACGKRLGGTNVGVLVCGPEGLQSAVASQCRAFNTVFYHLHQTAFSYHSVSFDF